MNKKLVIVSKPDINKHFIIKSNDTEEITLIGDVCINGSISGIGNTYEEALTIYNNLKG